MRTALLKLYSNFNLLSIVRVYSAGYLSYTGGTTCAIMYSVVTFDNLHNARFSKDLPFRAASVQYSCYNNKQVPSM